MGHPARETLGVSPTGMLRLAIVLALCVGPFGGVHAVRPLRVQQDVLSGVFSSVDSSTTSEVGDGGSAVAEQRADTAPQSDTCGTDDTATDLVWPAEWNLTTPEQRALALSPLFEDEDSQDGDSQSIKSQRASRLLQKLGPLLLGDVDTLTIAAVGGSITLGDVKRQEAAYPGLFAHGLTEALGGDPENKNIKHKKRNVKITALNGAMGGTGSGYFALCINRHVSQSADLVLVELNVNDGTDRSFERVHRKLLDRENRPAVLDVLAEVWKEKMVEGFIETGRDATANQPLNPPTDGTPYPGFTRDVIPGGDWLKRLETLKHYQVPFVSQAAAIEKEVLRDSKEYPYGDDTPKGHGAFAIDTWLRAMDVQHVRRHTFTSAGLHLTDKGHKIIAELLLQVVFEIGKKFPCQSALRAAVQAAESIEKYLSTERNNRGVGNSLRGDIVDRPGGVESCLPPEALLAATVGDGDENENEHEKWSLVADQSRNTGEKKWGIASETAGAPWTVSLDTRVVHDTSGRNKNVMDSSKNASVVTVAYLASYENMGTVDGTCSGTCTCDPFTINALWNKTSSELALHEVRTSPPSEDCRVTLALIEGDTGDTTDTTPDTSPSKKQKSRFKVLQITIQEEFVQADRARAASQEAGGAENAFRQNA